MYIMNIKEQDVEEMDEEEAVELKEEEGEIEEFGIDVEDNKEEIGKDESKFCCKVCKYSTQKQSQWSRHLLTLKHKTRNKKKALICECGKIYMYNSRISKHQTTCVVHIKSKINNKELIETILKENNEFKQLLIEQNKTMMEMAKKSNTTINNNNTNNFNLQFFLNVQCKDALNISDFLDSLKIEIKDLQDTGRLGFVEGVSKILLKRLKSLDVNKRPIHCSDEKRESLHIKDNNIWEKETDEYEKVKSVVRSITHKNIQAVTLYHNEHPDCRKSNSKHNDEYLNILINIINGSTDEERDSNYGKIISKLSKEFVINKNGLNLIPLCDCVTMDEI